MSRLQKKKLFASVAIVILVIISIVVFVNYNKPQKTVTFNRVIKDIQFGDGAADIYCLDDNTKYAFYDFQNVTVERLKVLGEGDEVSLTVIEDYKNFLHPIVYKMSVNEEILFDSTAYYEHHNLNISVVFLSIVMVLLLVAFVLILIKKEKTLDKDGDFYIKAPDWERNIFIFSFAAGIAGFVPFWVLFWLGSMEYKTVGFSYPFLIFAIIGLVGICVYKNERFICQSGVYTYIAPFKKKQQAKVEDIAFVEIDNLGNNVLITFFDEHENKLIVFRDRGRYLEGKELLRSFSCYKIPRRIDIPNMDFYEVKQVLQWQLATYGSSKLLLWIEDEEYIISYYEDHCTFNKFGADKKDVFEFSSIDELYISQSIDGIVLNAEWSHVKRLVLST